MKSNTFKVEALCGSHFNGVVAEALRLAQNAWAQVVYARRMFSKQLKDDGEAYKDLPTVAEFVSNGITVRVAHESNPKLIERDWERALNGLIEGPVGPYPSIYLDNEVRARDEAITAENQRKYEAERAAYRAAQEAKEQALFAKLETLPAMERDEQSWQAIVVKQGEFGAGILAYAETWARLMQAEMANGKTLEEVANPTSFEADTPYGMSGATHGLAVWTLTQTWKYGEELRRWHNKDHDVDPDQPGVVNPAILVISTKEDGPVEITI